MNPRKIIALAMLFVMLGLVNWSIFNKEQHLAHGQSIFLALAPVDPRSLIQGDYMALDFQIAREIHSAVPNLSTRTTVTKQKNNSDGYVVVSLDDKNRATFSNIFSADSYAENERVLHYRIRDGQVKLATNAFFFQEGHADKYTAAKYGHFRVNTEGELLLVSMHNDALEDLALTPQDAP